MNFLGHLYLSNDNYPLMVANLFGDFVKGKDYTHLPLIVQKGVKLHRQIDSFTDQHPTLQVIKKVLYPELPKIAPIALDIYLDHLLAKHWNDYHSRSLNDFNSSFFNYFFSKKLHQFEDNPTFTYPKEFQELITIMYQRNWLNRYKELEGLDMACSGLSRRISFTNNLHEGLAVFLKHEKLITSSFREFIQDTNAISTSN